jgi:hypothetical protein
LQENHLEGFFECVADLLVRYLQENHLPAQILLLPVRGEDHAPNRFYDNPAGMSSPAFSVGMRNATNE